MKLKADFRLALFGTWVMSTHFLTLTFASLVAFA